MANNFITNNSVQKTLSGRINNILKVSTQLRWLVGFFYFSGWQEVYENLKHNPAISIKLLVGLEVGSHLSRIFEHDLVGIDLSSEDYFLDFLKSLGFAINNEEQDTKVFFEQVHFFLEMLKQERLIIRKTRESNHAKLYLFELNNQQQETHNLKGYLITGSSNLSRNGLRGQQEFNVEVKDYGYEEAVAYFEELWERAIQITEIEERKKKVIDFILHRSQAATVSPFEAYALILKTFLDLQGAKLLKPQVEALLEKNGFKKFSYQLDAVNQALKCIEENNGVIIADVVGLGKSVIASLVARNLNTKGIIICPPGLMGTWENETGWWGYVRHFGLDGWQVFSRGKLDYLRDHLDTSDFDIVIVDEAHSFRNQDTEDYESLTALCREKRVILLTATPFNNAPSDIFSLLKLFLVPGQSTITLEDNLEGLFRQYNYRFQNLSYILKNYASEDSDKRKKAASYYSNEIGQEPPVKPQLVRNETKVIADTIKEKISPVVIRRNRLDLKQDYQYSQEIGELSIVEPPKELFYYLSPSQSAFYDRIVKEYFAEDGIFKGAIYQPAKYENIPEKKLNEEENRQFQQQRNLYDFMRRLLVKRFESSFGAFEKSINRFIHIHKVVSDFIKQNGRFILDRELIEKIQNLDKQSVLNSLERYEKGEMNKKTPKNTTVYVINKFKRKDDFLRDIKNDLQLFEKIAAELKEEDLVANDPKREVVFSEIKKILTKEPNRKIILFTEYVDTVLHLQDYFREKLKNRVLVCDGHVSKNLATSLEKNFNGQYEGKARNNFDLLITSDKLSEGFNLNRAGAVINYDIPWNPTRVIQRVGRINRIGKKIFDRLYIFNFFPSETGSGYVKSREIAAQKMFMIHNTLGEDAQIFDPEEEPSPSRLFHKINSNPEEKEDANLLTKVRNLYHQIEEKHPEVIKKIGLLPPRVKTAKKHTETQVNTLRKKGLSLFAQQTKFSEKYVVENIGFETLLKLVTCDFDAKRLPLSENFWPAYEAIKSYKENIRSNTNDLAISKRAHENLKVALKTTPVEDEDTRNFIQTLIDDIKHYYTMPTYTLRRLATSKKLTSKSPRSDRKEFFDELNYIKNLYGPDYLERILERVKNQKEEMIIAVENRT